jgi:hypothetical protein
MRGGLGRSLRAEEERQQRGRNNDASERHQNRMFKARKALESEMAPNDGFSSKDADRLDKAFVSWTNPANGRIMRVRRTSAFGKTLQDSVCANMQKSSVNRLSSSVKKHFRPVHTFLDVHASSLTEAQWENHVKTDPFNTWLLSRNPHHSQYPSSGNKRKHKNKKQPC